MQRLHSGKFQPLAHFLPCHSLPVEIKSCLACDNKKGCQKQNPVKYPKLNDPRCLNTRPTSYTLIFFRGINLILQAAFVSVHGGKKKQRFLFILFFFKAPSPAVPQHPTHVKCLSLEAGATWLEGLAGSRTNFKRSLPYTSGFVPQSQPVCRTARYK